MRWGVETSFRHLKYSIGLLDFHSKKVDAIEMEVWARLILYNYSRVVTNQITKRTYKSKYVCQPNITNAIHICCRFLKLCGERLCMDADILISRELLPIRPDRSSSRKNQHSDHINLITGHRESYKSWHILRQISICFIKVCQNPYNTQNLEIFI